MPDTASENQGALPGFSPLVLGQTTPGVAQIETATGRLVRVNQRLCDLLGYSRAEIEQMDFRALLHPDDSRRVLDSIAPVLSGRLDEGAVEARLRRKDGVPIWTGITLSALPPAGGRASPPHHRRRGRRPAEACRDGIAPLGSGISPVEPDRRDFPYRRRRGDLFGTAHGGPPDPGQPSRHVRFYRGKRRPHDPQLDARPLPPFARSPTNQLSFPLPPGATRSGVARSGSGVPSSPIAHSRSRKVTSPSRAF